MQVAKGAGKLGEEPTTQTPRMRPTGSTDALYGLRGKDLLLACRKLPAATDFFKSVRARDGLSPPMQDLAPLSPFRPPRPCDMRGGAIECGRR